MVYGIDVKKVGQRIGISRVWTRQTFVLSGRASILLECMIFHVGECRSVLYGVVKIPKSVGESSDCMDWR